MTVREPGASSLSPIILVPGDRDKDKVYGVSSQVHELLYESLVSGTV